MVFTALFQHFHHGKAVHPWHDQFQQNQVAVMCVMQVDNFRRIPGDADIFLARLCKQLTKHREIGGKIDNDQNACRQSVGGINDHELSLGRYLA